MVSVIFSIHLRTTLYFWIVIVMASGHSCGGCTFPAAISKYENIRLQAATRVPCCGTAMLEF